MKRLLAPLGATVALVVAGASMTLIGGSSAGNAAGLSSSAFALQSTGLIPIDAMPAVVSNDGQLHEDSIVGLPDNPLITGGALNASAGDNVASASVSDLSIGGGIVDQLPQELKDVFDQLQPVCDALNQVPLNDILDPITGDGGLLDLDALDQVLDPLAQGGVDLGLVTALDLGALTPEQLGDLCNALDGDLVSVGAVMAECEGNQGTTTVTDVAALGLPSDIDFSEPNSKLEIPGVLTITGNRQTNNPDGTFTVDALVVNVLGQVELTVASATCGDWIRETTDTPDPSDSPTPVETNHPVTG